MTKRLKIKNGTVWPIDETCATMPENWNGWPENKRFAFVLSHDVDSQEGHDKALALMELERKLGFKSSFNFVPERYRLSQSTLNTIINSEFELCVHGLKHDGKLYWSEKIFKERAARINEYLKSWQSIGFTSPSMHRNLKWMHLLNIKHATSTFDTDPFEPQPDGIGTIFPFWVYEDIKNQYVELPYTLPQDFTVFILMEEKDNTIWKEKLNWIAEKGGMALLNSHPDYMQLSKNEKSKELYPVSFYEDFLTYVKSEYDGQYWHALPRDIFRFCAENKCAIDTYKGKSFNKK